VIRRKEIQNMRTMLTTTILGLSLLVAAPHAWGFGGGRFFARGGGGGGPHGGGPGMPLRLVMAQLTQAQRQQVRQILIADRGTMHDTLKQLHDAHEALADKMLAPGPLTQADVDPLVQKIGALHQQLLQHGTQVMLQVRAVATPEQLANAAAAKQKIDQLRTELGTLLGHPSDDSTPDAPE
jgi:Spy/CpxP family protein refolding chaperone